MSMNELSAALGVLLAFFSLGAWYGQMLPRGRPGPSQCFEDRAENARVIDELLNRDSDQCPSST